MSEKPSDKIQEFYNGRYVFCTGATGMLGTAYISRLILDTAVARVYALARGGESRLWQRWSTFLPLDMVQVIRSSEKLIVLDGDITHQNCGLSDKLLEEIHENVSLFVHGAATINLKKSLQKINQEIVRPSVAISDLALGCAKLTQFVYISTAYSSTFLRRNVDGALEGFDSIIPEEIRHIRTDGCTSAEDELSELAISGSTREAQYVEFPFPYSYGKHLTERLLSERFEEAGVGQKLLIFRPSLIGPAESQPYPHYEIPGSSPITFSLASLILAPPTRVSCSSKLSDPYRSAAIDEIPVDIVVNRLVAHVALKSSGCVHAVAGPEGRQYTNELFYTAIKFRRYWWGRPKGVWRNDDWDSPQQSAISRLYVMGGCSFIFDDAKTKKVWEEMSDQEQGLWPLWPRESLSMFDRILGRQNEILAVIGLILNKFWLPAFLAHIFFKRLPVDKMETTKRGFE